MNFPESITSVLRNYATFTGRASRSEYWYWALFCLLVRKAANLLDMCVFSVPFHPGFIPTHVVTSLFVLAVFVPSIAVGVRRLHDVDRKGTWLFIGLTVIGLIYPLLVWKCTKGTVGANRFGEDPCPQPPSQQLGSEFENGFPDPPEASKDVEI